MPGSVHVVHAAGGDAHALLQDLLLELTGTTHEVRRRCGACGGPHGRPVLDYPDLFVSLSRTAGRVVVAATRAGPVGVDVERAGAARFAGFDGVALAPGEVSADPARTWVRKEAVLKAAGTGLSVDPREVDVTHDALGSPWPGVVVDVPVADFACAAAVLGVQHVEVLVREAGRSPAVRRPVGRTAS